MGSLAVTNRVPKTSAAAVERLTGAGAIVLGKTNTPELDSAGSEYYITLSPQYHLDNAFTVFGRVVSGFDVLGRLVESDRVIRIERIPDVTL